MSMSQESNRRKPKPKIPASPQPKSKTLPFSANARKFYPFLEHTSSRTYAIEAAAGFLQEHRYIRLKRKQEQAATIIGVAAGLISGAMIRASAPGEKVALEQALKFLWEADNALFSAMHIWTEHKFPCGKAEEAVEEFVDVIGRIPRP